MSYTLHLGVMPTPFEFMLGAVILLGIPLAIVIVSWLLCYLIFGEL